MNGVVLLSLAVVLLQAVGVYAPVPAAECRQSCPDDDADGRCAPSCDDCGCCRHAPAPLVVEMSACAGVAAGLTAVNQSGARAPLPPPLDIAHVPKSFPA